MTESDTAPPEIAGGVVAPSPASASIAAPAIRGSIWTLAGYAASQALRLASNLVLTRLLFPEVFGQMALVSVFLQGLAMFSDVGTGPAIIQSSRGDDPQFLNTAWTIQSGRGILLWLFSWVIAQPVASFYGQPLLFWLVPAAGLTAVMGGFESTSMHTLQRHLRLGMLTVVDLFTQFLGIAAMIGLAFADRSLHGPNHPGAVWAIIGGSYVSSAGRLVLSHTVLPGIRHRICLERDATRQLFRFGRWIFISTMLTFLAAQSDRLVFGKMIPLSLFGVYGIAAMMATLPTQAVQRLGSAVIFPAYSRLAGSAGFKQLFERVRTPFLIGGAGIVSGLIACGPFLIRTLYDSRYEQAGWILQFLCATAWFQILECTNGAALLALGRVFWVAMGSAVKVIGMLVLIPLGFHFAGFPGALLGLVLAEAAKYLTSAAASFRCGLPGFIHGLLLTAAIAGTSYAGIVAGRSFAGWRHGGIAGFLTAGILAGGVWGAIGLVYLSRQKRTRGAAAG